LREWPSNIGENKMNTVTTYHIEGGHQSSVFYSESDYLDKLKALKAKAVEKFKNYVNRTIKEGAGPDEIEHLKSLPKTFLSEEIRGEVRENGYATRVGYSDYHPYEIVKVISDKTIEVRGMDAKLLNGDDLIFHTGGFSAHCSNQDVQEYNYSSNENNPVIRLRKNKKGQWISKGDKFMLETKPYKFHDYNF
jgi:hypothetical protein